MALRFFWSYVEIEAARNKICFINSIVPSLFIDEHLDSLLWKQIAIFMPRLMPTNEITLKHWRLLISLSRHISLDDMKELFFSFRAYLSANDLMNVDRLCSVVVSAMSHSNGFDSKAVFTINLFWRWKMLKIFSFAFYPVFYKYRNQKPAVSETDKKEMNFSREIWLLLLMPSVSMFN